MRARRLRLGYQATELPMIITIAFWRAKL